MYTTDQLISMCADFISERADILSWQCFAYIGATNSLGQIKLRTTETNVDLQNDFKKYVLHNFDVQLNDRDLGLPIEKLLLKTVRPKYVDNITKQHPQKFKYTSEQIKNKIIDFIAKQTNKDTCFIRANMNKSLLDIISNGNQNISKYKEKKNQQKRDEIISHLQYYIYNEFSVLISRDTDFLIDLDNAISEITIKYTDLVIETNNKNSKSGLRYMVPFCELSKQPCRMANVPNHTQKPYCEFINCQLYRNIKHR